VASFVVACIAVGGYRRRRLVQQCAMTMPLALRGWPADRDCLRYGMLTGQRCVTIGWPLMLAITIQHGLLVMAAGTILMAFERRGRKRRPRIYIVLTAALGIVALVLAMLAQSSLVGGGHHHDPMSGHHGAPMVMGEAPF